MQFSFFPYGNARETKNPDGSYAFSCQHGSQECLGNMVEACAMHFHNSTAEWWPFVYCLESGTPYKDGSACAQKVGWSDWSEIEACTTSSLGNGLMHNIAQATSSLQPPHQWTPWVVVNGKPLTESQMDQSLLKVVCDQLSPKPAACNGLLKQSEKLCRKY